MPNEQRQAERRDADAGPPPASKRWKMVGPGIVVAVTGVGAGDLVATLIAGNRFGYTLLWAAVLGCVVKIALSEAVGRWHLATGRTMFEGWRDLGSWTSVYFLIYVVIWGFVYGATVMSSTGLAMSALVPVMDTTGWGIVAGLIGFVFVAFNRYALFERVMKFFIALMFVTVVTLAFLVAPNLGNAMGGLVPRLPEGSAIYTLGLIGGVGGTITLASYGYWVNAKGWRTPAWMPMMRFDNTVGYVTTGIFVIAMMIVGAELLFNSGVVLAGGDRGLLDLDAVLRERLGDFVATLFLVGFAATTFSSLLGVWHGVSMLFADFVTRMRGQDIDRDGLEGSMAFRFYLFWLTFPPISLLFLGRPFALVVAFGALGALFMPFLAITLLWLLNSKRVAQEWRSGWLSNCLLIASAAMFAVLAFSELMNLLG
ncbi:Nramp family divalent metal transporter [Teichococcus oryzae]|uniref:Divalent metal cation transporter n=1 Tax=Teichococcus oryzae TaxID=1608942 RepID=A0A5B2TLJ9_9PROT|nr:Nramp family divalent metal transporter [Pseudoroseomonas oryzae]KAA2214993.1 divalent metal cation transporter [Pseudoroseomonas oryzae]